MRTLLFIIADRLSQLVSKGEVTDRYYNPGNFFDEVHLLSTTSDSIDPELVAPMAGSAKLFLHRLWKGPDKLSLSVTPLLDRFWKDRVISLARRIKPDLVRTGDRLTGYLGCHVKKALGIPHIISLHTHRDDLLKREPWGVRRWYLGHEKRYASLAICTADVAVIVYESLRDYVTMHGAKRVAKIYNIVSPNSSEVKFGYQLGRPPAILSVGRQLVRKQPDQLIRGLRNIDAHLTVVGDGPRHKCLREIAYATGISDRVHFQRSMSNTELNSAMTGFDLFAVHTDYPEFPKTILEAMWHGLPVVVNNRQSLPVPELQGEWVQLAENTPAGYANVLETLMRDDRKREVLGRRGREYAERTFAPNAMEQEWVRLYAEFA